MPIILGSSLLLPPNANVAGAYQDARPLPQPLAVTGLNYRIDADFFVVLIALYFILTTDAGAGPRIPVFYYTDPDGHATTIVSSPASQGPNAAWQYTFAPDVATLSAPGGGFVNVQVPTYVLQPGWRIHCDPAGAAGADQVSSVFLVSQRYPTGTPASQNVAARPPALV